MASFRTEHDFAIDGHQEDESSREGTPSEVSAEQSPSSIENSTADRSGLHRPPVVIQETRHQPAAILIEGTSINGIPGDMYTDPSLGDHIPARQDHYDFDTLYNDPSAAEVNVYGSEAMRKLSEKYDKFRRANGLFIVFSNRKGYGATTVDKIHNTSDKLCDAFRRLGFACCQFRDCSKAEIMAVYKELATMDLPGYKSVIIYYVGHGEDYYINVKDGFLSIPQLTSILSTSEHLADMVKVLIFDCCRTGIELKPLSQIPASRNVLNVYTTALGQEAFVIAESGESIASTHLVRLLERQMRRSLTDLLGVDFNTAMKETSIQDNGEQLDIKINFEGCLDRSIDLYEDKLRAMAPTGVTLDQGDRCILRWKKPLHADHQHLLKYFVVHKHGNSYRRVPVKEVIGPNKKEVELQCQDLCGKQVTIMAHYCDVEVPATEFNPEYWRSVDGNTYQIERNSIKDFFKHNWCLIVFLAMFVLLCITYAVTGVSVHQAKPQHNILAVAGDTIDCGKVSPTLTFFYSKVGLTQQNTDKVNDNPRGLSMRVGAFDKSEIIRIRQIKNYNGSIDIMLDKTYKMVLIPEGYFAYPPYLWEDSNITIQVNVSDYATPPTQLVMYVLHGNQNYRAFARDSSATPNYEYQFDLLGTTNKTYHRTVKKNGYYYIVVKVNTKHRIHFSAAVKFDYYSLNGEDLDFSQAKTFSEIGYPLWLSVDFTNKKTVVCAVDPQQDRSAYFIHIHIDYGIRSEVIGLIPIPLAILCIILLVRTAIQFFNFRKKLRRYRNYVNIP